uniref:spondin domain-containing protein n=1 Tax=Ningiella ruwaisensis TaxID=2364274 RepID=UPI00109F0154|nr:spondin domain-containing protein [Ningiella ruwaisensis]
MKESNNIDNTRLKRFSNVLMIALLASALAACGGDNDDNTAEQPVPEPPAPVSVTYELTITNLSNAQPLSPVALILHSEGNLWTVGQSASQALEQMAEGGQTDELRSLDIVLAESSGAAPIGPGGSETITVSINDNTQALLSVATMLVNTNDGFTGLNAYSLADLGVGDAISLLTRAYDAGTEVNSEAAGTMPGPADNGEGFNVTRDDVDFVALHQGVVSADDGLSNSVLNLAHKFDNPVMRISILRVE